MYGFRINNNIPAINTYRQLRLATASLERSLERLSSGLRMNRGADDVAGLAISERMRNQVRGLQQASRNASQAINLIQTAEGALNEIHSILARMRELAVEAASDNVSDSDRSSLDNEFQQLKAEITRIAESTEYNNVKLLDGTFSRNEVDWSTTNSTNGEDLTSLGVQEIVTPDIHNQVSTSSLSITDSGGNSVTIEEVTGYLLKFSDTSSTDGSLTLQVIGAWVTLDDGNTVLIAYGSDGTNTGWYAYNSITDYTSNTVNSNYTVTGPAAGYLASQEVIYYTAPSDGETLTLSFDQLGVLVTLNDSYDDGDLDGRYVIVDAQGDKTFQVGADNATNNTIGFSLSAATAAALGLTNTELTTLTDARSAITDVDNAIETINTLRARLGAIQNRLEFTISNLDNIAQNIQASESTIRDTDFAEEITNFTRSQILVQAATAMLAQANALPQNVLALLGR